MTRRTERQIVAEVEAAAELLARVANTLGQLDAGRMTPIQRMLEAQVGHPRAAAYDSASVSGGHGSDPTASLALGKDQAHLDLCELDMLAARAWATADRSATIIATYQARAARPSEKASTIDGDGCKSCARVGRWEPARTKTPTTLGGLLDEPQFVCRWCEDHARSTGRLPSRAVLEAHHEGKRVQVRGGAVVVNGQTVEKLEA